MTPDEVVKLMKSSRTAQEWDANCDKVKAAFGGDYPEFWRELWVFHGLAIHASNMT